MKRTKEPYREYYQELSALTVFRGLLSLPLFQKLMTLLDAADTMEKLPSPAHTAKTAEAYCDFAAELYAYPPEKGDFLSANFSRILRTLVLDSENCYMKAMASGHQAAAPIETRLQQELDFLQRLSSLSDQSFCDSLESAGWETSLPRWSTSPLSLAEDYARRIALLPQTGWGIFAACHTFLYDERGLVPVRHPDLQSLSELSGYERERSQVLRNTENFLDGGTASNVLLYGDAGTGKSSTIKAIANSMKNRGLRLVEVKKNQLYRIPDLLDQLSGNPLKFILFIDDLSFSGNDDNFSALKAILEGGVAACGKNVLIYATSNRRHLVKETMTERQGDELYLNDTLQETMSLAARFGLTITFQKPGKDAYLSIVRDLAKQYGLEMDEEELCVKAEAFAIRSNGRSPRTAKHFVELQKAGL